MDNRKKGVKNFVFKIKNKIWIFSSGKYNRIIFDKYYFTFTFLYLFTYSNKIFYYQNEQ
ncbi:hypothetical protein SAMN04488057_102162 [Cyclobacterium lianum]|uniref:Uncharacterized protein n=1 Tax=Cyclobacterium lianum TaxID=388280 RepID=A0A1M7JU97_9BACT|nr:hypothetical protein SAMN04488057_102162 [Cyclobacterium lianum]